MNTHNVNNVFKNVCECNNLLINGFNNENYNNYYDSIINVIHENLNLRFDNLTIFSTDDNNNFSLMRKYDYEIVDSIEELVTILDHNNTSNLVIIKNQNAIYNNSDFMHYLKNSSEFELTFIILDNNNKSYMPDEMINLMDYIFCFKPNKFNYLSKFMYNFDFSHTSMTNLSLNRRSIVADKFFDNTVLGIYNDVNFLTCDYFTLVKVIINK